MGASRLLMASAPNNNNDAWLGRADCSTYVSVTAQIVEDRDNWPDDVIKSVTFKGGVTLVNASCGNGEGWYFSKVSSSTGASGRSGNSYNCD